MKILVIKSSPHKNGSSNLLAGHFMRGPKEAGHMATVFDAARSKLHPCLGCEACGIFLLTTRRKIGGMVMNNRTLTQGAPWKGILSFMIPVLLGLLLQQLYNTVDTIIVGNFAGEAPLAAVGACGVLTMAFLALANGFSAGACILIAQLFGAGKEEVVNVVLDIIFVYNMNMGVVGAAVATDIAQAVSCIVGVIYMMKKYPLFRWKLNEFTFEWKLARQTLKTGFPMALQQFIVSFGFVFIQRAVNSYGEAMTASFSVAQKVETYMILPANALMTTQGTYTGQNIGAGRTDRVMIGAKQTALISEIISVCILTAVFIFAKPIVTAFGLGSEAVGYCTAHVRFAALCLPLFASYFPLLGLFQGADNALFSTFVATGALTVRVATTYLFQGIPGVGYHMIWWNTLFGWGLGSVITWTHFLREKWQTNLEQQRE